jgi:hypothetical protein
MAYTPPTNPEDSYELSPFGFGPFPLPGESVDVAPAHPEGGGYGGVGFLGDEATGGTAYGLGSYGSTTFGRPRMNISGGYGGDPYGLGGYGGTEVTPPFVSSAISLNGYQVEVYFSEEVDTENPALLDPLNYTLEPILGAAPATVTAVHIEKLGSVDLVAGDTIAGAISVVITHTGTTLGGLYKVHAYNLTDLAGNPIIDADAPFLAKGEPPNFVATLPNPDPGNKVLVTYSHPMYVGGNGYEALGSYTFGLAEGVSYPIVPSATDDLVISDALAFSFDTTDGLVACTVLDAGTATVTESANYLVVSKAKNLAWSREWQDTSGTITPLTSTLRADCTFDFGNAGYDPVLSVFTTPEIAEVVVQDGPPGNGLLVRFTLQRGATGQDQIRIRSGSFDQTVDAIWSDAQHTLSFVRNMLAGIVTFVLDDAPLFSTQIANVDGVPETQASVRFGLLNGGWNITGVRVYGCLLSSSTTVFSAAWNFMHDQVASFVGSAVLAKDHFLTQRGPLVKGWGDATPATEQDVTVEVNGTEVEVAEVNPYIGKVTMAVPVPLMPVGEIGVAVDYKWFKSPVMELAGLNTEGLVLNKYDCPRRGHHDPAAHGDQVQVPPGQPNFLAEPGIPKGAVDIHRFPMGVVLGPIDRAEPLYIGHRYMGFERAYSALINSPTTLLLNQAPGRVSVPGFEREVSGVSVAYGGLVKPQNAVPAWALDGSDCGGVDADAETGLDLGTYTVLDAIVGQAPTDSAAVYHRGLDLTYPSSVNLVGRLQLSDVLYDDAYPSCSGGVASPTPEGVFTGVGFGLHDNRYLYLVGLLIVNGVEHVGMLLDPKRLHEWDAWDIGPKGVLSASSQSSGSFVSSQVPSGFTVGSRFQVLSGTQAGVYTATAVTAQCDGTTTVTFSPELPAQFDRYGNRYIDVVFETRVSEKPFTYRLDIDTDQQVAELRVSGETTAVVATIDGNVPALPLPASSTLLLPRELVGQVFWGSLSRQAASRATWSFFRYGLVPDQVFLRGHAVVNNTEMSDLPENNPAAGGEVWWTTGHFGRSEIMADEDTLLLRATSSDDALPMSYGYARVEPFFIPDSIFDLRTNFRVDATTSGSFGIGMLLDDTSRLVQVRALMVRENVSADETRYRRIVDLPKVSMSGLIPPTSMGWAAPAGSTLTGAHEGAQFVTRQTSTSRGRWTTDLVWGDGSGTLLWDVYDEGRVLEARLAVVAATPNANGDTGIIFGCHVYGGGLLPNAIVQVELAGTAGNEVVRLGSGVGAPVAAYSFNWNDGEPHTYRVLADRLTDTVSLVIDDVVQIPATNFSAFQGATDNTQVFFGSTGRDINNLHDNSITATVEWHYVYAHAQAPQDVKRTIGVLRGISPTLDEKDINNYELPRIDASTAPNSWQYGPEIEWWDWRQDIELRVYRDPGWGVTIFRPDLPPPPYYQPEDGTAGVGFITESNEPSAGWINVEYRNLPRSQGTNLGYVMWGSLGTDNIGQSRWDWVRYRLFRHPTEDRIAPEHMVLNQYNVMTSGEMGQDKTLETVIVPTMDKTRLSLLPTHLYADNIYKVIDGSTVWTSEFWAFDRTAQLLTLQPDPVTGEAREFSADHANVTVMFIPGKPVTNTYLARQPLLDSVTLLNEGTPPVPKNQTANSEIELVFGSHLNDPADVLNDDPEFVLNDPHRTLRHKDVAGSLYEDLEFIEVTNDGQEGLIASICEHGPGQGFSGYAQDEGEDIYSPDGTGDALGGTGGVADHFATGDKVGRSVGAEVFDFSGTQFWYDANMPPQPDFEQKGGSPGGILFASGGNFVNPVVDEAGNILPNQWVAGGGNLGPGTAVLYPSFPAKGRAGDDSGRIYRRTEWFMDLRSVLVSGGGSAGSAGGGLVDHPLEEEFDLASAWTLAATGTLYGAGDYSRYGPWGGWDFLEPARDEGTWVLLSVVDGTTVALWDRVGLVWVVLTARNVPLSNTEFATGATTHTSLAAVVNAHPDLRDQYEARAGLSLSGELTVTVYSRLPSTDTDPALMQGGATVLLRDTLPHPTMPNTGVLAGGAKLVQSSLLAGGEQTIDHNNDYDPRLGMVALGGSPLPAGGKINLIFT